MLFQERIKNAIKTSGLTQKEIAKKLNIRESNITNWKKGENFPSIEILYKLCIILDESSDYLLGLEDEAGIKTYCKNYVNQINNSGNGNVNFN